MKKNKKNTRKIGEDKCKEAIEFFEKYGHQCDGPFYKVQFVKGRMRKVHVDIFGCFDFISLSPEGKLFLNQVTSSNMKSNKIKKIRTLGIKGILLTYNSDKKEEEFKVFQVSPEETVELRLEEGRFIEK